MVMSKSSKKPLYFFTSVGCAFCGKAVPIIDELINEGYDILKLDTSEPENKKIKEELQKKYNTNNCGTPLFINPETGHNVCGFREKDILKKWADGEEIPEPPRPTGPPPKPPLKGASKKIEKEWKKDYDKWLNNNSHLPNLKTAEEVLDLPRPKTEPPPPPTLNYTDDQYEEWRTKYESWKNENKHLPNLQPADNIIDNFKQRAAQSQQSQPPAEEIKETIFKQNGEPSVIDAKDFEILKKDVKAVLDKQEILSLKLDKVLASK